MSGGAWLAAAPTSAHDQCGAQHRSSSKPDTSSPHEEQSAPCRRGWLVDRRGGASVISGQWLAPVPELRPGRESKQLGAGVVATAHDQRGVHAHRKESEHHQARSPDWSPSRSCRGGQRRVAHPSGGPTRHVRSDTVTTSVKNPGQRPVSPVHDPGHVPAVDSLTSRLAGRQSHRRHALVRRAIGPVAYGHVRAHSRPGRTGRPSRGGRLSPYTPPYVLLTLTRWQVLTAGRSLLFFDATCEMGRLPDTANRTRYTFARVSDSAVHYLQSEYARTTGNTPTPRTGTALRDSGLTHRVEPPTGPRDRAEACRRLPSTGVQTAGTRPRLSRVSSCGPATVAWFCRCHGQAEQSGSGRTSQPC